MLKKIFTIEELEKLCEFYQKLLRIQDWRITIKFVHQSELGEDVEAEVSPKLHSMIAVIKIPTPESWIGSISYTEQDMRMSLIHELIHLVFIGLGPSTKNAAIFEDLWECGIEKVTETVHALTTEMVKDVVGDDGA